MQIAALRKALGSPSDDSESFIVTSRGSGIHLSAQSNECHQRSTDIGPQFAGLPREPSISVLPFTNLSGNAEQNYFADGLAEDITTSLSRLRWLVVAARNSSFSYKSRSVDARLVGKELGVRYVLNGNVRCEGQRLRIGTQLTDATSGLELWADRFEGEIGDFFALRIASPIRERYPALSFASDFGPRHASLTILRPGVLYAAMPFVWTGQPGITIPLLRCDKRCGSTDPRAQMHSWRGSRSAPQPRLGSGR